MQTSTPPQELAESTAEQVDNPDGLSTGWKQIRLFKTFCILLVPCLILSFISGGLYLALGGSTPDTFDDIHFWFYFFDVGREINVPTWYSSIMWVVAGLLAGYFALKAVRFRLSWALFASICVLFSVDEMLELHERLDVIGAELEKYVPFEIEFVWVIPGVVIAGVFVLLLLRMVLSLPGGVRNGLIIAGIAFVSGAIGVETLSGRALAETGFAPSFFGLTLLEETLEMSSIALCIASLLHLIEHRNFNGGTAHRLAARVQGRKTQQSSDGSGAAPAGQR